MCNIAHPGLLSFAPTDLAGRQRIGFTIPSTNETIANARIIKAEAWLVMVEGQNSRGTTSTDLHRSRAVRDADREDGWVGINHEGGFFAWHGPLAGLDARAGEPPVRNLLDAIRSAGMTPTWGSVERLEQHFRDGRMQVFATDRRTWMRPVFHAPDGKTVLLVHVEDDVRSTIDDLQREHDFNEGVSAVADSDKLGTEFVVSAIQRTLDSGAAGRLGREIHEAFLQARGAM